MILKKKLSSITNYEYLVPTFATISLIISCIIISSKKYFWNDELYSYYLLADQSFTHMLVAFHDKINNTPILYFLLGWLWAKIFSSTEISLRLFSSLSLCIAFLVIWITLRRTYSFISTSLGVLAVFCTSNIILYQNAEARMYGLFLAVCSFGLLQYDSLNRGLRSTRESLFVNICIHAAIVHTHLFGIFYSGAILFAQLIRDLYHKVFRFEIYISIALGWLSVIFYVPSFISQADAGKPRTWIPIPTLKDLIDTLNLTSNSFFHQTVLILIVMAVVLQFILFNRKYLINQQTTNQRESINTQIDLLLFAYSFLLVPIVVWLVSRTVKPIFIDRYMIPTSLSWSILLTHLSSYTLQTPNLIRISEISTVYDFFKNIRKQLLLIVLVICLLLYPIKFAMSYPQQESWGLGDSKYGYHDLPIVLLSSGRFMPTFYYSSDRDRYFYILDWQAAVDKNSGVFPPQEYKHMDAYRRVYPELFQENIVNTEGFLEKHSRFLVILGELNTGKSCPLQVRGLDKYKRWEDFQCPQWLRLRINGNPRYQTKLIGKQSWESVFLVEKKQ